MSETTVGFRAMKQGTAEDYRLLLEYNRPTGKEAAHIAIGLLKQLDDDPAGFPVNRYVHSLQTATRAMRDGVDEELLVCALLHDIGEIVSPFNHPGASAEILQPFISPERYAIVRYHGLFQSYYYAHHFGGDRNARDAYRAEPWFKECVEFCERYDQASFDPDYETFPLERFVPAVESVFSRSPQVGDRSPIIAFDAASG